MNLKFLLILAALLLAACGSSTATQQATGEGQATLITVYKPPT